MNKKQGQIIIYKDKSGKKAVDVRLKDNSVWLNTHQIAELFDIDRTGVVRHVANIYKTRELDRNSTCAKIAQFAKDGKIRQMDYYNLDMIISVGYRVNSKKATQFRIWATSVLKDYVIKGYAINKKRLEKNYQEFEKTIKLIKSTVGNKALTADEKDGLLKVVTDYADSWVTLQRYDEDRLKIPAKARKVKFSLGYEFSIGAISELKANLIKKKQASSLFGQESGRGLEAILGNLYQSFGRKELYPGLEEKAANLLYLIIKDHPFTDGNKRIECFGGAGHIDCSEQAQG
jgi:prophage antirepressor-like protein